jgi:hypothetical protein
MDVQFIGVQVYKNDFQKLVKEYWYSLPMSQDNSSIVYTFFKILEDDAGKLHIAIDVRPINKLWHVSFKNHFCKLQKFFDSTQLNDFTNADEAKQKANDFLLKIDKLKVFL